MLFKRNNCLHNLSLTFSVISKLHPRFSWQSDRWICISVAMAGPCCMRHIIPPCNWKQTEYNCALLIRDKLLIMPPRSIQKWMNMFTCLTSLNQIWNHRKRGKMFWQNDKMIKKNWPTHRLLNHFTSAKFSALWLWTQKKKDLVWTWNV